jgi:cytochrome c oxidase assembly factor CtaG
VNAVSIIIVCLLIWIGLMLRQVVRPVRRSTRGEAIKRGLIFLALLPFLALLFAIIANAPKQTERSSITDPLPQGRALVEPPDASGSWADFFSDRALAQRNLVPLN